MSQLSLGIIETLGLAAAIQVADICVKSANVNLIGYEFSKGSGMTVIKIEGNVGAVKSAVEAALLSTDRIACSKVIARPNPEIENLIRNGETVGYKEIKVEKEPELEKINIEPQEIQKVEVLANEIEIEIEKVEEIKVDEIEIDLKDTKKKINNVKKKQTKIEVCNICRDPKCTRKKGELISTCINYKGKDKGRN